jgi:hypothetical protein
MLDRASSAAARARRHRTREKRGEVVLRLPVVEHQVAEALLAFGRLDERAALDRGGWNGRWRRPSSNGRCAGSNRTWRVMSDRGRMTWLAVCSERSGYALDAYPEELAKYRREVRSELIGEFASYREALDAVFAELERRGLRSLYMNSDRDRRALRIIEMKARRARLEAEPGARQRTLPDKRRLRQRASAA